MEELLNKLIEKGWRPRGYNDIKKITVENNKNVKQKVIHLRPEIGVDAETLTRFICVKESGLWQFVCKNEMVDRHKYDSKTYEVRIENWIKRREVGPEGEVSTKESWRGRGSAEYRLIESALCDEDKLEEFLLKNIKVE